MRTSTFFVGAIALATLPASAHAICAARQTRTTCPATGTLSALRFPRGMTVYYKIDGFYGLDRTMIEAAITAWNTENAGNSHVVFKPWTGGSQVQGLEIQAHPGLGNCKTAQTVPVASTFQVINIDPQPTCDRTLYRPGATVKYLDPAVPGYSYALYKVALHELGHTMGFIDTLQYCETQVPLTDPTVITTPCWDTINDQCNVMAEGIGSCDDDTLNDVLYPPPPPPPNPCITDGGLAPIGELPIGDQCGYSPIVIDLDRDGYDLSSALDGVLFDLDGDGRPDLVGWPSRDSDDAWLALDRNGNGVIDDGTELFGNVTAQPAAPAPNGFLALGVYDQPAAGGNGDGVIDDRDQVFASLRLWRDLDHNGLSSPNELIALPAAGVRGIDLAYHDSRYTDANGNVFRYRARILGAGKSQVGQFAYDVFPDLTP